MACTLHFRAMSACLDPGFPTFQIEEIGRCDSTVALCLDEHAKQDAAGSRFFWLCRVPGV